MAGEPVDVVYGNDALENCKALKKERVDSERWVTEYVDESTGERWVLEYIDPHLQGGGRPRLRRVDDSE